MVRDDKHLENTGREAMTDNSKRTVGINKESELIHYTCIMTCTGVLIVPIVSTISHSAMGIGIVSRHQPWRLYIVKPAVEKLHKTQCSLRMKMVLVMEL